MSAFAIWNRKFMPRITARFPTNGLAFEFANA